LTTQNVAEFWNVCTRPQDANGLGLGVDETEHYTQQLEQIFTILPDSVQMFRVWRRLVVEQSVIGAKVHDARLVAAMKTHNVPYILTFNAGDFLRYADIAVIHPAKFTESAL
jgi:hypothetical protein